ncbi:MAG: hypothetical protein LBN41_10220 [Enterobacteriaceae bacterium]|jgi:hypothetical protein|nr:hypothetical protein [Enterobacteriaceae bacterium]
MTVSGGYFSGSVVSVVNNGTNTISNSVNNGVQVVKDTAGKSIALIDNVKSEMQELESSTENFVSSSEQKWDELTDLNKFSDIAPNDEIFDISNPNNIMSSANENNTNAAPSTKDFNLGETTDETCTSNCPLSDFGSITEFDDSSPEGIAEINDFYDKTLSFMGSFFEPADAKVTERVPLQKGIPFSLLNQEIAKYAKMDSGGADSDPAEQKIIETAKEITAMDEFFDAVREEIGDEEFLNFALLFDEQARESPSGKGFIAKYKGKTVDLEDAKFKIRYHNAGANIIDSAHDMKTTGFSVEHVKTHGSTFWGDDFVVEVSPNISIYKAPRYVIPINLELLPEETGEYYPYDMLDSALIIAENSRAEGLSYELVGKSLNKDAKALAKEFVEKVIQQADDNRNADLIRDVTIEIVDAVITVFAVVSGAIVLKAAAKGVVKLVSRVALFALNANHGVEAIDKLHNRWIGSKGLGYNPLLEFSRYLDDKKGGGHGIETIFHSINTVMVFGGNFKFKLGTAVASGSAGAYMGNKVALVNEIKTQNLKVENAKEGEE